jgi:ATP-dependent DNA helicase RecG
MEPEVRPVFTTVKIGEKFVVSAQIPPISYSLRPVYHKAKGIQKGSYIRIGDADKHMNDYEIYSFTAFKG